MREEFKAHKEVPPAQADAFMKTWQEYWVHLARSRVRGPGESARTACSRGKLPRGALLGTLVCHFFCASGVGTNGRCRHGLCRSPCAAPSRRVLCFPLMAWLFSLQGGPVGRDLDEDTTEALSDEQVAKLGELAAATRTVTRGGDDDTGAPHGGK